jgi:hypothetical protein
MKGAGINASDGRSTADTDMRLSAGIGLGIEESLQTGPVIPGDRRAARVNRIRLFIVSHPARARKFQQRGLPCVGDDIQAQTVPRLFIDRWPG